MITCKQIIQEPSIIKSKLREMILLACPSSRESCLANASDNRFPSMTDLIDQDRPLELFLQMRICNKILRFLNLLKKYNKLEIYNKTAQQKHSSINNRYKLKSDMKEDYI